MLAVLASSGCYLPNSLTMGGHNGPDDFSFSVDTLFSLGPNQARRLNREWMVYVDDFCARMGRWREGSPVTDAQHDRELASLRDRTR